MTPQQWAAGSAAAVPPEIAKHFSRGLDRTRGGTTCRSAPTPACIATWTTSTPTSTRTWPSPLRWLQRCRGSLGVRPFPCRSRKGSQGPLLTTTASCGRFKRRWRLGGLAETPIPLETSQTPPATWSSRRGRFVPRWVLLTHESIRGCMRCGREAAADRAVEYLGRVGWVQDDEVVHELEVHTGLAERCVAKAVRSGARFPGTHSSGGCFGGCHVRASGLRSREHAFVVRFRGCRRMQPSSLR